MRKLINYIVIPVLVCLFFIHFFPGKVIGKDVDKGFMLREQTPYQIVVFTWYGKKRFAVSQSEYHELELEKFYFFKREPFADRVRVK